MGWDRAEFILNEVLIADFPMMVHAFINPGVEVGWALFSILLKMFHTCPCIFNKHGSLEDSPTAAEMATPEAHVIHATVVAAF